MLRNSKPVGETQFHDLKWEDGKLEARLRIGVAPTVALAELSDITVDKLLHDVTEAEVEEELLLVSTAQESLLRKL